MPTKEKDDTTVTGRTAIDARKAGQDLRITANVNIRRPVGEAFAFAGDYETDPLWRSGVVEMRYETPGVPRAGARGGPVPVWGSRTFEPVDGGARFTYDLSMRPGGPWALLSPVLATMLRRRAARDLKKLKALLELGG